jgi:hypothetical protein
MSKMKPDKEPAKKTVPDRGESIGLMESMIIGDGARQRPALTDLALDLAQKSAGFRRSLPESLLASLADLVRSMNCYYSNLIEGHNTHPIDIERALKGDYSKDTKKRDLQMVLRQARQERDNPRGSGRTSSPCVDSPVPRRQRARDAADVARNAAGGARYGRSVVDRPRPRPQCRCL